MAQCVMGTFNTDSIPMTPDEANNKGYASATGKGKALLLLRAGVCLSQPPGLNVREKREMEESQSHGSCIHYMYHTI